MLVSRHSISCAPAGSTATDNQVFGVQNVLCGGSIRMIPRYIFTAAEPGDYHCWMGISTGRPRPTTTNQTANILKVDWGSYLEATTAIHSSSAQGFAPKKPSPDFKIKVFVKHVSGADLIVHKQGTITAVIPPAPTVTMNQPA
jgi:hypothetical protein